MLGIFVSFTFVVKVQLWISCCSKIFGRIKNPKKSSILSEIFLHFGKHFSIVNFFETVLFLHVSPRNSKVSLENLIRRGFYELQENLFQSFMKGKWDLSYGIRKVVVPLPKKRFSSFFIAPINYFI